MRHLATCLAAFGLITAGAAFAGENCTSASGATCGSGSEQIAAAPAEGASCPYTAQTAAAAECSTGGMTAAECPAGGSAVKEIASTDASNCDTAACPASECTGNETVAATADEAVEAAPGGADEAPATE